MHFWLDSLLGSKVVRDESCGVCGGSMTVMGRLIKAGVRYATFGCTTHNARGPSICPNSLTISERKATAAILGALQDALTDPLLAERFKHSFERRLGELTRASRTPTPRTSSAASGRRKDAFAMSPRPWQRSVTRRRC